MLFRSCPSVASSAQNYSFGGTLLHIDHFCKLLRTHLHWRQVRHRGIFVYQNRNSENELIIWILDCCRGERIVFWPPNTNILLKNKNRKHTSWKYQLNTHTNTNIIRFSNAQIWMVTWKISCFLPPRYLPFKYKKWKYAMEQFWLLETKSQW